MRLEWTKNLTRSDARQETKGSKMPFRFTKGTLDIDHSTWFREVFFKDAPWFRSATEKGTLVEKAEIVVEVIVKGRSVGHRRMSLDHREQRSVNNSAPATHLLYDEMTNQMLESDNFTDCPMTFRVQTSENGGTEYSMRID